MKNVKNYEKMIRYDERIMKYAEKLFGGAGAHHVGSQRQ